MVQVILVNPDKTKLGAPVDEVQEQSDSGDGDAGQVDDILVDLGKIRSVIISQEPEQFQLVVIL